MRLVSARIRGFGRLVDTTIKLDQKVVAIVGPNEAGKTTLLKALAYAEHAKELKPSERSRSTDIGDETPVISLRYILDQADKDAVAEFDLEEEPTEIRLSRRADGGKVALDVLPAPRACEADLRELTAELAMALNDGSLTLTPVDESTGSSDDEDPDANALLTELRELSRDLDTWLSATVAERSPIGTLGRQVQVVLKHLALFAELDALRQLLTDLRAQIDKDDPTEAVSNRLWSRTPDIMLFTEADRSLKSAYVLDDKLLADVPAALTNLARLARLDLHELANAASTGQIARRDTMKNRANAHLKKHFMTAWKQSDLRVELNVERNVLRIGLVEDDEHASVFDERSAGLRMFVALSAFLASRRSGRPAILLIDEAETHLHIDAQADLVEMFAQQDKADKVIYTTHSPACLPADLGVGIRAVVPKGDETSRIENSFWRLEGGAYSSLMFAMGASAAAFTPARCVVMAEGASDMILLPSLIRLATNSERLSYQIAPGLSETPQDDYPNLDFEAAKVAYLVDNDKGGDILRKALQKKVPGNLILRLGVPGVENTLRAECYLNAFLATLRELNPSATLTEPPALPASTGASWASSLEDWVAKAAWRCPTKREVASYLLEHGEIELSNEGTTALRELHLYLLRVFGMGVQE